MMRATLWLLTALFVDLRSWQVSVILLNSATGIKTVTRPADGHCHR